MFQCQHGPTECMGNKVHACSIKHIKDDRKLTDYIHCMIEDNYDPKEVGQSVILLIIPQKTRQIAAI